MAGAYITMDLVIEGRFNLTDLVAAVEREGLSPGPVHVSGGVSKTRLGMGWYQGVSTPDKDAKRATTAVEKLSPQLKREWDRLHRKEFDFGLRSAESGGFFTQLSAKSLQQIVEVGGSIGFSIYQDTDEPDYTSADVDAALEDARNFAMAGELAKALERHVWYHENALKYHPSHSGVRLSFALAEWAELAQKYPPAAEALRNALKKARANMKRDPGNYEFPSEAMSIAMYMKDYSSAKELFYETGGAPHYQLTSNLDEILETGDIAWVDAIIADPYVHLKDLTHLRQIRLEMGEDVELRLLADRGLVKQLQTVIACLTACGRTDEAEAFRQEAIKTIDSKVVHEALEPPGSEG